MSDNIAADQLRLFIERITRLEEEKKGMGEDIRDTYQEAKSAGFDQKTLREMVRLARMDHEKRAELLGYRETYQLALGF